MGKRELLLIIGFVIAGAVVYQATAPPPGANERTLSLSRFIEAARREIGGNRASTVVSTQTTIPVDPEITELRVVEYLNELEIVGENRPDVEASLRVHSSAYNDAEAKQYGEQTVLKPDRAGTSLLLRVQYVRGRHTGRQRASLVLKVPSHLRARVESRPAKLSVSGLAGLEATNSGGEAAIRNIHGRVAVTHRGGSITIEDVAALKFTGRGAEAKINGVASDTSLVLEQGGEVTAARLAGPLDVESRNADVTLENLEPTRGPIRINAINGSVTMKGVKSEARVDGRNAELTIVMSGAAPLAIYSEGEQVSLTPPTGGFRLDAVVVDGRITPEPFVRELGLELSADSATKETRASGQARGGGPTITIRATRTDLTFRQRDRDTP